MPAAQMLRSKAVRTDSLRAAIPTRLAVTKTAICVSAPKRRQTEPCHASCRRGEENAQIAIPEMASIANPAFQRPVGEVQTLEISRAWKTAHPQTAAAATKSATALGVTSK
ncbi:MAG: hypothetical protein WDO18_01715 [Acidobacteriota bacterium]